jgi:hypothetical protein
MYNLTTLCCNFSCPKIFSTCFNDFTISHSSLENDRQNELLNWMRKAFTNNPEFVPLVQTKWDSFRMDERNTDKLSSLESFFQHANTNVIEEEMVNNGISAVMSPMHKAVVEEKFGLWCVYRLLGGEAAALNGCDKSSIQIISDSLKNDPELTILKFYSFDISKVS